MLLVIRLAVALAAAVAIAGSARADYVGGLDPSGDNFLSLRTGPGGDYPEIRRMGPATALQVLESSGGWRRVRLRDGTVGWAFGRYVYPGDPPGMARPAPPPPPPAEDSLPAGVRPVGPLQRFDNGNIGAVINGPTADTIFSAPSPVFLVSVTTYHWNFAHGRYPGTVALRAADGTLYGPWKAQGRPGQGGVRDAYWRTEPRIVLPAGRYRVVDSDPSTWATNAEGQGRGFAIVEWQAVSGAAPPPVVQAPPAPPPQPAVAGAEIERLKLEAEIERLKLEQLRMRQSAAPAPADKPAPAESGARTAETRPPPEPKAVKPDGGGGRQVALVIGNCAYQAVTPLPTPANDARRWPRRWLAAWLRGPGSPSISAPPRNGRAAGRSSSPRRAARASRCSTSPVTACRSGPQLPAAGRRRLPRPGRLRSTSTRARSTCRSSSRASAPAPRVGVRRRLPGQPAARRSMASSLLKGVSITKGLAVIKRESLTRGQFVGFAAETARPPDRHRRGQHLYRRAAAQPVAKRARHLGAAPPGPPPGGGGNPTAPRARARSTTFARSSR